MWSQISLARDYKCPQIRCYKTDRDRQYEEVSAAGKKEMALSSNGKPK